MPTRHIYQADGIEWLRQADLGPEHAVVTSLPDVSELTALGFDGWRRWFIDVASLICQTVHPDAVAIFYQTDIKRDGRWIDKAHLIQCGADDAGAHCLWHKIVCRKQPGATTFGRPAYGHWLAVSRGLRLSPATSTADVLPELGEMTWSRAMPMTAAIATCVFLQQHTQCRVVVDPFCGRGTILAVANKYGFDAIGVELSKKRVKKARALVVDCLEGTMLENTRS
jgi:hypothetical protein